MDIFIAHLFTIEPLRYQALNRRSKRLVVFVSLTHRRLLLASLIPKPLDLMGFYCIDEKINKDGLSPRSVLSSILSETLFVAGRASDN